MKHSPSSIQRAIAAALTLAVAGPDAAFAQTPPNPIPSMWYVSVLPDGTFSPKHLEIRSGDFVRWSGLGRTDSVVQIRTLSGPVDPTDACFAGNAADPAYANPYRRAFAPVGNEFTGPVRNGVSGIWALSTYGGDGSLVEIPSAQAEAITPGITAADGCAALDHPENDALLYEDPLRPEVATGLVQHRYVLGDFNNGEEGSIDGNATDPGGAAHVLCHVQTSRCNLNGGNCRNLAPDPAVPATIPPGTFYNGLLDSTYTNPDVTGVVLRFNWRDLQYDDAGTVRERWEHLDRELERAIAGGKMVVLDLRAGMFGTPDWIFTDYLVSDSGHAAPWCVSGSCAFVSAHVSAGHVQGIDFVDYYDSPQGLGCGAALRIGAPGDAHYRALFKDFMARLAAHIASDSRWFQTVAHVKVSGANLRTSEAELPHHCDDLYTNTADHYEDPKTDYVNSEGDRVLDVFKIKTPDDVRRTAECACNTEIWYDHGYTPQQLYDYYAEVENQILVSFFGRKSIVYDLLQDGFPRADARPDGGFLGDHLYREVLQLSTVFPGVPVNSGYESEDACGAPSVDPLTGLARLFENRANGATEYCSHDSAAWPDGGSDHIFLGVEPLLPDATFPSLAAHTDDDGTRFPRGSEQSETILDQGGNGRFGDPASPTYMDRITGKLFVPQHNGLQVLPQERVDLDYNAAPSEACVQQRARIDIGPSGGPPEYVADFPILGTDEVSTLATRKGCPNQWIVNQGSDQDVVTFTLPPPFPPQQVRIVFPPQLTGYQTSNKVRSQAHVESALFNLVYNTNAVYVELYDDAIWRIGVTRGSGLAAAPLDDPADPKRTPNNVCDQFGAAASSNLCYSKNLYQWSEELHRRRSTAATLWASLGGLTFPALADPFPSTYIKGFVNTYNKAQTYTYINPMRCDPALVDLGSPQSGLPSALGTIKVLP